VFALLACLFIMYLYVYISRSVVEVFEKSSCTSESRKELRREESKRSAPHTHNTLRLCVYISHHHITPRQPP
jgi:hypothetical protein